jgi:superfamily II DNA/RNA helicase
MSTTFAQLGIPDALVRALAARRVVEPFPIQAATIPDALAGRDVSGMAPTGSGKTLAFGLALLARVDKATRLQPRGLVLAPTRELAEQIKQELAPLADAVGRRVAAVYGGVGYGPQKNALRRGVDVLVATPGRLEDLMAQGAADLGRVDFVVIDEADRMADMGFLPAVRRIVDTTSPRRQTLLFSATLDGDVAVLSRDYQRDPVRHDAGTLHSDSVDADHHFWLVDRNDRVRHAADVIETTGRSIVFTRTRHGADRLAKQLDGLGVKVVAIHGGRSQRQRDRAIEAFSSGRARALVATDVAARGIHVDAVASVIHYDPTADAKDYLHRSGRTARAGATGTVVSLVTDDQQRNVRRIQQDLGLRAPIGPPRVDALRGGGHRITTAPATGRSQPSRTMRRAVVSPRPTSHLSQSVYVANLPWAATADEVRSLFGRYGDVHQTAIVTDRRTGRSRGFGFVDMPTPAARAAVDALHGFSLGGRELTVKLAEPKRRRA